MSFSKNALAIVSILALSSLTTAWPNPLDSVLSPNSSIEVTANYDNLPKVLATTPLASFNLLNYTNINYKSSFFGNASLAGDIPPSEPNFAAFGGLNTPHSPHSITSLTTCFELKSLFAACAASTPLSDFGVPAACKITLSGYDSAGTFAGNQTFDFEPTGLLTSQYYFFDVTQIGKVKTIEFTTTDAAEGIITTVLDNLTYVLHEGKQDCKT